MSGRIVTVRQFAEEFQTNTAKALEFIANGELRAFNIARRLGGKPRWRITQDAIDEFIARRSSKPPTPPPKPTRAKRQANAVEYY